MWLIRDIVIVYFLFILQQNPVRAGICPVLTNPPNGSVDFLQRDWSDLFAVDTTALLICDDGFQPRGLTAATCLISGEWSAQLGTCEPDPPTAPTPHSLTIAPKFTAWGELDYGSSTKGGEEDKSEKNNKSEQSTKTRDEAEETAKDGKEPEEETTTKASHHVAEHHHQHGHHHHEKMCDPISTMNGFIGYDLVNPRASRTLATLFCNAGYLLNGTLTTVCRDGQWIPPLGNCYILG